jgi:hypothetical protein
MPGTGKSFEQFNTDDAFCRQFAYNQIGGTTTTQPATDAAVSNAVVGALIGAAVGVAFGGRNGTAVGVGTAVW